MAVVLFFLCIILTFAVLFLSFKKLKYNEGNTRTLKSFLPLILTAAAVVISLLSSFGIMKEGPYQGAYTFCALVSAVSCFIPYLPAASVRKELMFIMKAAAVAAFLELTLFNIPSYRTWTGSYPVKEFTASDISVISGGYQLDDSIVLTRETGDFSAEIANPDIPVSTVFIDMKFCDPYVRAVPFSIDTMDETHSMEYRTGIINSEIVTNCPGSHYAQCDLSGKIKSVRINMKAPEGERVSFSRVVFNLPVPFNIQYIRFFAIVCVSAFIFSLVSGGFLSVKFSEQRKFCELAAYIMTLVFMLGSYTMIDYKLSDKTWSEIIRSESGNQVSEELVEAFKKGHVYLDRETEDFLYELDNPYDENQRDQAGSDYAWDHVFYNGHYYSYYGIAPVILLFLPYNLITGYYCPNELAILVFAFIAFAGISMMYMEFIRRWFSDVSSGIVLACLFILQVSSGLWYSLGRPDFYEIALAAGLAFISWSMYFLFRSGIVSGDRISYPKTALASLFFALAVLSRPTLAVYCICAAGFMIAAVPRASGVAAVSGTGVKKYINGKSVKYMLCAFVPMAVLGICQMTYNYVRFGSPFDFGIQYSLTINDFTRSQFHLKFSVVALYNYLFNPPVLLTDYPFVKTQFQHMHSSGYFYVDTLNTLNSSGLFMLVPVTWFYLAGYRALREFPDRKQKTVNLLKVALPCLAAPVIIIASVWESGYAVRYMGDFSVEVIIGSYAVMLWILKKTKNTTIKKLITGFVCFSLVWVLYIEGVQLINQTFRYQEGYYIYPEVAYKLESIISFWR